MISFTNQLHLRNIYCSLSLTHEPFFSLLSYHPLIYCNHLTLYCIHTNHTFSKGAARPLSVFQTIGYISIRAPTRGATSVIAQWQKACTISIHAPTRGATLVYFAIYKLNPDFNPRSHEGSDGRFRPPPSGFLHFNPRSHEGSDSITSDTSVSSFKFQSTLPRGERQICTACPMYAYLFQSTLPRGERLKQVQNQVIQNQFQSTLPRGERPITPKPPADAETISIHAPTRGATPSVKRGCKT